MEQDKANAGHALASGALLPVAAEECLGWRPQVEWDNV